MKGYGETTQAKVEHPQHNQKRAPTPGKASLVRTLSAFLAQHRLQKKHLTIRGWGGRSVDGDDVNSSLLWHNKHHLTKFISIDTYLSQMMVSEGLNNLFTESVRKGVGVSPNL